MENSSSKYTKHDLLGMPVGVLSESSVCEKQIVALYQGKPLIGETGTIVYEPEIKQLLGIPQTEKVACLYEKTCGAVLYTEQEGKRKFLLIKNESGHIGFPKGHIELDETEPQTAIREVYEETGLHILPERNFRMEYHFATRENTQKMCVYFLAHYDYTPATLQESEILQGWLVPFQEAMQLLNFPQDQEILLKAQEELEKKV